MFCHKCGAQVVEGADFCQKCGAKLIVDDAAQQSVPSSSQRTASQTQQNQPAKKKSKLPIILGAVAAVAVLFAILAAIGGKDGTDSGDTSNKSASGSNTTQTKPISENTVAQDDIILYGDIYVSQLYGASVDQLIEKYGPPSHEYEDGSVGFEYFDFSLNDDGSISAIIIFSPEKFTVNGTTLNTNTLGIVEQLGNDYDAINDPDFGYCMRYYYSAYTIIFEIGAVDGNTQRVWITRDTPLDNNDPSTVNKILCKGIPVDQLLGASTDNIISAFGEPETQNELDLEYGIDEWEGYTQPGWMCFYLDDAGKVNWFSADSANFTVNSQSLQQDFDTLVTILGEDYIDLGATTYVWNVAWNYGDYQIAFAFPIDSDTDMPYSIDVFVPNEDIFQSGPADNLPVLPDGFEWVEAPSWTTKSLSIN